MFLSTIIIANEPTIAADIILVELNLNTPTPSPWRLLSTRATVTMEVVLLWTKRWHKFVCIARIF